MISIGAKRNWNNGRRKEREIGVVIFSAEEGKGTQEEQESRKGEAKCLHNSILRLAFYLWWRFSNSLNVIIFLSATMNLDVW